MKNLPLNRIFQIDALTCLACAVAFLLATATVATLTGLSDGLIWWAGIVLAASAAFFALLGFSARPSPVLAALGVFGNLGWIVASFAVLVISADTLTPLGSAFIIAQAVAVGVLAFGEAAGLRTLQAARV